MLICQMYLSRELLMQCTETQNAHFRDSQLKSIKVWHLNVITGIILRKNYNYVIIDVLSFPSSFPFLLFLEPPFTKVILISSGFSSNYLLSKHLELIVTKRS